MGDGEGAGHISGGRVLCVSERVDEGEVRRRGREGGRKYVRRGKNIGSSECEGEKERRGEERVSEAD